MKQRVIKIGCIIVVIAIALISVVNTDTSRLTGMLKNSTTQEENDDMIVYRTKTGNCFHVSGCSYLRGGGIEITYGEAKERGLQPCSRCKAYLWVNY